MLYKATFRAGLCALMLTIASCADQEAVPLEDVAKPESKQLDSDTSEVIVSLGDKKLTIRQVEWVQPNADEQKIAKFANWWLENELLYAEARKRGLTRKPKAKFIADMMKKRAFSQELRTQVQDDVKISDKKVLDYYEKNKETDPSLKQPGYLSFSHIRTKTLEEATVVLERIKAGEDINALAKELSIYGDAKRGGVAKKYLYKTVKGRFGPKFFEALMAAEKDELIGPVEVKGGNYEVARQRDKTEPKILPFEKAKERIRSILQRKERAGAFKSLLASLKEQAAGKIVKSQRLIEAEKARPERVRPTVPTKPAKRRLSPTSP